VVAEPDKQTQILISQLANTLDGMYEAREQGDIERELRLREQMIPLLVQALTSKNDDLLELSVYCVSLIEKEAYLEVMDKALSRGSNDPQIIESIQRVAEVASRPV
jgi:hypothetical protein